MYGRPKSVCVVSVIPMSVCVVSVIPMSVCLSASSICLFVFLYAGSYLLI